MKVHGIRKSLLGLGAIVLLNSPAMAASEPSTRLVKCLSGHCVLVSGHREDAASAIRINGHAVAVEGKRHWRVRLPVETVRAWSAPFARTITVASVDAGTQSETLAQADLPIGLLGHVNRLASLVVRVR